MKTLFSLLMFCTCVSGFCYEGFDACIKEIHRGRVYINEENLIYNTDSAEWSLLINDFQDAIPLAALYSDNLGYFVTECPLELEERKRGCPGSGLPDYTKTHECPFKKRNQKPADGS